MPAARDPEHEPGQADTKVERAARGRGRARRRARPARAGRAPAHSAAERAPSGTLNQNTQCQEIATSAPPSTGPSTSPTAATIVLVPIATPELLARERVGDERGGVREQERAADALQDPPQDQLACRLPAKPAPSEASGEDDEAGDVGALAAEEVRQPARREHEHGRGDHVGEDHPDELQQARVQAALEVGQGDDQRAGVDRRQQHPEARARQRPPLVVVVLGVDADARPKSVWLRLQRGQGKSSSRILKIEAYVNVR